jgi:hypothetical protein
VGKKFIWFIVIWKKLYLFSKLCQEIQERQSHF